MVDPSDKLKTPSDRKKVETMRLDTTTDRYHTDPKVTAVYSVLRQLGITANYTGFFHASYSVLLAMENPQRLLLVTKWLYPEVAKRYHTTAGAVERNIRTVVLRAWQLNREILEQIAGCSLETKPTVAQFISILSTYLQTKKAA